MEAKQPQEQMTIEEIEKAKIEKEKAEIELEKERLRQENLRREAENSEASSGAAVTVGVVVVGALVVGGLIGYALCKSDNESYSRPAPRSYARPAPVPAVEAAPEDNSTAWYNPAGWFGSSEEPEQAATVEEIKPEDEEKEDEKEPLEEEDQKKEDEKENEGYSWYNPVGWVSGGADNEEAATEAESNGEEEAAEWIWNRTNR